MKLKLQLFFSEQDRQKAEATDADLYLNLDIDTEEWKRDYHMTLPRTQRAQTQEKLPRRYGHVIH